MEELLQIDNLKVHYPIKRGLFPRVSEYVHAVDGISFSLGKAETLGLVGESGCGKTSTGLAILNLIPPTAGKILFKGVDIAKMTGSEQREMRKRMQCIFQDPYSSLNPRMTINQIVNEPLRIHGMYEGGERADRIAYLLEKVGLTAEQGRRYPHEFSGGQRQRVGIARALALNPEIIIGDEPVSALDVSIQAQIINLLLDLQEEFQLSYIIIAHDLAVVKIICDRVAVMYLGKIVEIAPFRELYNNPRHPYTRALLSAIPQPDPRKARKKTVLKGDVPNPINPPAGCRFHPRCTQRMARCDRQIPVLKGIEKDHLVACFMHDS